MLFHWYNTVKTRMFFCTVIKAIAPIRLCIAKAINACCGSKLVISKRAMATGAMIPPIRPTDDSYT